MLTSPQPEPTPQRQLFQNKVLTAIFGRSVGMMITRIILVITVIGTLAIIAVGLLRPNTMPQPTTSTIVSSSKQAPVGTIVGDAAPNFTLTLLNGKKASLSDYRGKAVLLNFLYSTCPGCQAEIPGIQHFYAGQQAAHKDFVVLGVDAVDDAATAQQFAQQQGMTYPIMIDSDQRVSSLYGITDTPTSFFIDRNGIIRATQVGPVDANTLNKEAEVL